MRVLHVMPGVNPSAGAERSFAYLAPALRERGIDVHLAVLTDRQGLVPQLERDGVVIHDLSGARSVPARVTALGRVLDAIRADLVHAALWEAAVPAQIASRRAGVPVVVTWAAVGSTAGHSGSVSRWKLGAVRTADRALARVGNTQFHAVTEGVAEANGAALGVPRERIHVVERGRPESDLRARPSAELRAELGLDPGHRVVLAVGRHEPVKDHVSLVRAASIAHREVPGLRVLVAGRDGSATRPLCEEIDRADLAGVVHLLGQRDDVADLMHLAEVVAMTSRSEGAAGAVIEAFRAGTPVVATDVAGLRDVLVDRGNALVAPVGAPAAIARAIVEVLEDGELAGRLAREGRSTYEQRFTMDRSADGTVEMYRAVMGRDQNSSRSP